tara:strand:+ start:69 stop:245 length:177 start_codon:yes stop_codon:yes gene_type:complete
MKDFGPKFYDVGSKIDSSNQFAITGKRTFAQNSQDYEALDIQLKSFDNDYQLQVPNQS